MEENKANKDVNNDFNNDFNNENNGNNEIKDVSQAENAAPDERENQNGENAEDAVQEPLNTEGGAIQGGEAASKEEKESIGKDSRQQLKQITVYDAGKRKKKKRKKKKSLIPAFFALVVVFIFVYLAVSFKISIDNGGVNIAKRMKGEKTEITLTIEEGSGVKEIAERLRDCGAIDSSLAFVLKCKRENIGSKFNYGDFKLNSQMTFYEIAETLEQPNKKIDHYVFTVKEGMTQKEIAQELEKQGIADADDFMAACDGESFDYDFLKSITRSENRLEGYLFPDTYELGKDDDCTEIINRLLARFDEIYSQDYRKRAAELGLTDDQVITMASVIEREVRYPDERKTVASVIYNRLKADMPLQMDSTVLYALGENKDRVLISDTEVESEYNTYIKKGLPAGPISSPGEECIKAVLYPDNTDYLYYVVENDETGQHFFTSDYNEFLKAKEKYVSKFDS